MSDSATPWTVTCQAPLSVEFSRQGYRSGLPCPFPGDFPSIGLATEEVSFFAYNYSGFIEHIFYESDNLCGSAHTVPASGQCSLISFFLYGRSFNYLDTQPV